MKDWKFVQVGNGSGYNGSNLTQEKYEEAQKAKKRWEEEKKDAEATIAKYEKLIKDNPANSSFGRILDGAKARVKEAESNLAYLKREIGNKRYFSVEEEDGDSRDFNSLSEARRLADKWAAEGKQTIHIFEIEENDKDPDDFRIVRTINKSVGNATIQFYGETIDLQKEDESRLKEILEELQMLHEDGDTQRAIKQELQRRKTGNESVVKQEWSMFKGLSDDAKKEIGNDLNKALKEIRELEQQEKQWKHDVAYLKKYGQDSRNAEKALKTVQDQIRLLYSMKERGVFNKVGNGSGLFSYEDRARIAKQRYLEAKSKKEYPDGVRYEERMAKENIKHLQEILAKAKSGKLDSRYDYDTQDIQKAIEIYKQIGNSKVGNLRPNGMEDLTGKNVWVKDKGDEWQCYVLQDKGEKLYIRDTDGHMGWVHIGRVTGLVGNKKIGNASLSDMRFCFKQARKQPELYPDLKGDEMQAWLYFLENYKWTGTGCVKVKKGNSQTGNEETKAERKFGKVMGEFEEGSLKTPQGKTVTDPKQAKAIAYSEADKVDNLKRARNAMNKKVENGKYYQIYDEDARELMYYKYRTKDEAIRDVKKWLEDNVKDNYELSKSEKEKALQEVRRGQNPFNMRLTVSEYDEDGEYIRDVYNT